MDIKVDRNSGEGKNYNEIYANERLAKFFKKYRFLESVKVFFRGDKHKYKKVKLQARMKGKDVFVEGRGGHHDRALDEAADKLNGLAEKYKSKHYKRA